MTNDSAEERAEHLFDTVSEWFASEIAGAIGNVEREIALCRSAVERYAEAKRLVDPEGLYENVVHFFGVDGIGFERERAPALDRVPNLDSADRRRLCERLGEIAMALESESLAR